MTLVLDRVSKVVGGRTHIHPTTLELRNGTMTFFPLHLSASA